MDAMGFMDSAGHFLDGRRELSKIRREGAVIFFTRISFPPDFGNINRY